MPVPIVFTLVSRFVIKCKLVYFEVMESSYFEELLVLLLVLHRPARPGSAPPHPTPPPFTCTLITFGL